jgi:hypothetical protein
VVRNCSCRRLFGCVGKRPITVWTERLEEPSISEHRRNAAREELAYTMGLELLINNNVSAVSCGRAEFWMCACNLEPLVMSASSFYSKLMFSFRCHKQALRHAICTIFPEVVSLRVIDSTCYLFGSRGKSFAEFCLTVLL